jgi:hypothetical protein
LTEEIEEIEMDFDYLRDYMDSGQEISAGQFQTAKSGFWTNCTILDYARLDEPDSRRP